jgi:putative transposase
MDSKGRVYDNMFVERLWRSVKYEEVYLKDYVEVPEALEGIGGYFRFYNNERPHQAREVPHACGGPLQPRGRAELKLTKVLS